MLVCTHVSQFNRSIANQFPCTRWVPLPHYQKEAPGNEIAVKKISQYVVCNFDELLFCCLSCIPLFFMHLVITILKENIPFYFCFLGTAEDSLGRHNNHKFSTKDQDNDASSAHCAVTVEGAWWFFDCRDSSLNGVYYHGKSDKLFSNTYCIKWGSICPVKRTEMKIRPTDF